MMEVTAYPGKYIVTTQHVVSPHKETIFKATTVRKLNPKYRIFKNEEYEGKRREGFGLN
jgi:hypothetical protein